MRSYHWHNARIVFTIIFIIYLFSFLGYNTARYLARPKPVVHTSFDNSRY